MEDFSITIIRENGLISKEKVELFQNKTVSQILNCLPHINSDNSIMAIKTPTCIKILEMNVIPLNKYPELKSKNATNVFSIPDFSIYILNKSNQDKKLYLFFPISMNNDKIQFPPFVFGITEDDFSKSSKEIISDLTSFFDLKIENPAIFLNNKELPSTTCSKLIQEFDQSKDSEIQFRFNLTKEAQTQLNHRKTLINELIKVQGDFCKDLTLFKNLVGKKLSKSHIFTNYEYGIFFNSINNMFDASLDFENALVGKDIYSTSIENAILSHIPEMKDKFKEYFANFYTSRMIPEALERHKNNPQLKSIIQQTFEYEDSTFQSIAIKPIQLFPRLKLFAVDLKKYTPKSHPDYPLCTIVQDEIDRSIHELNNYHLVREVIFLQKRLIPLPENKNRHLDENERSLVTKYNVNQTVLSSKNTLYLLTDLIVLTVRNEEKEIEKFRFKYDNFFFIPVRSSQSIYVYFKNNFEILKFSSDELMDEMINNVIALRKKLFETNPEKNSSIKATECISYSKQQTQQMIDASCCKFGNLIIAASHRVYITFDTRHENSLNIFQGVKSIHSHAKLVSIGNVPYIFGGLKYPVPLEFVSDKFIEIQPKAKENNGSDLKNVNPIKNMKDGRIFHTCCSYKNYIVIYGGIKNNAKNQRKFFSDVLFYNVDTCEVFTSHPCQNKEPEPRYKHSAIVYKNVMIIHGGINSRNDEILGDTWCYNFNDGSWNLLEISNDFFVVPRFGHSAVLINHFMFVIGGATDSFFRLKKEKIEDSQTAQTACLEPAPNCFCVNIKMGECINVNLIGNFLPGLSLFAAAYDEDSSQIVVLGGSDCHGKVEKGAMTVTKMSVPPFFTDAASPEGDVDVENLTSSISASSRLNKRRTLGLLPPMQAKISTEDSEEKSVGKPVVKSSTPNVKKTAPKRINVPRTPVRLVSFRKILDKSFDQDDDDKYEEYYDNDDDDEVAQRKKETKNTFSSSSSDYSNDEDINRDTGAATDGGADEDEDEGKDKSTLDSHEDGDKSNADAETTEKNAKAASIVKKKAKQTRIKKFRPKTTPADDDFFPRARQAVNQSVHDQSRRHSDILSSSKKGL